MRMYDIIKKKRDGGELCDAEIREFISGYISGEIPDYQAAALLMAIYHKGMTLDETASLTLAIRDSGERTDFSEIKGVRVDKHSTGGVGDKTSLVITPIVASLGLKVAKMSGRGLGHTGGTIDKLESIPGFKTDIPIDTFIENVNKVGASIIGQTKSLAPADKLLYALRDVTATVDSMPLIVSSIMGKKLAADDDCILLDVKTGSGAFAKTPEESRELARQMVEIGRRADKKMRALITDMDIPLGNTIGNSLEVIEAVEVLNGGGPDDLRALCLAISAHMLNMAGHGEYEKCLYDTEAAIASGVALKTFCDMAAAQGADTSVLLDTKRFPKAKYELAIRAEKDGFISKTDTEGYGLASLLLGAGRSKKNDSIDFTAGIRLLKKTGDSVSMGEKIAILYANNQKLFDAAKKKLLEATIISDEAPKKTPLILDVIQ